MSEGRRSIRLKGYDYSQVGAYFVTICTRDRVCLFGDVMDGEIQLNEYGEIVRVEWFRSVGIRAEIELYHNEFVVMPNHIHGIVWIAANDGVGAHGRAPLRSDGYRFKRSPESLPSFIAGFKSVVTKRINQMRGTPCVSVWQRNYYEHIIRGEDELNRIREYIINNPAQWDMDRENPAIYRTQRRAGDWPVTLSYPWEAGG